MRRSGPLVLLALLFVSLPLFAATLVVDRSNVACSDATGTPYCTIEAAVDDAVDGDIIDVSGATTYNESVIIDDEDLTVSSDDVTAPLIDAPESWPVFTVWANWNWCINPEEDIVDPPRARPALNSPNVTFQHLRLTDGDANQSSQSTDGPLINGDDAIVLRKNTSGDTSVYETVVDVIGDVGFDPGNEWGSGATSTNRANLIRNSTNCTRDTIPTDAYTPSSTYTGTALHHTNATLGTDLAVTDLGTHTSSCSATDLMFSQYVESYKWRQALEIWNGTAGTITLTDVYRIEVYRNGSSCPSQIFDLTGSITAGQALFLSQTASGLGGTLTYSNEEGTQYYVAQGALVNVEDSNVTIDDIEGFAGTFYAAAVANDRGTVTINNSNFHDNLSYYNGGAIFNDWGTMTVTQTTVRNNTSTGSWEAGGGVANNQGTLTVNLSMVEDNDSGGGGGILLTGGQGTVTDSVIRNNTANYFGGGIGSDNGDLSIVNSTISGNSQTQTCCGAGDSEVNGGGIQMEHFASLDITNSTISGNSSAKYGGGLHLLGRATLDHVTFFDNTATLGGTQVWVDEVAYDDELPEPALSAQGPKTGADQGDTNDCDDENPTGCDTPFLELACAPNCYQGPAIFTYQNTVIATTGTDPCGGAGTWTSLGNNLVYPTDPDCGAAGDATGTGDGDIEGVNPMLLALADNGGPVVGHDDQPMLTHEFAFTSPLFDNGAVTEPEDQRGEYRPQGITSDIGAIELDAVNVTGVKSVTGNFVPGGNITYTIVLTNNGNVDQPDNPDPNGDEFIDVVPNQIDVTGADDGGNPGTTAVVGNTVTWNGAIPAGTSVTITITGTILPDASGTITNTGTINFDPTGDGTNDASFPTGAPGSGGPTVIQLATAAAIPALSGFALMLMAIALGMAALIAMRFRA